MDVQHDIRESAGLHLDDVRRIGNVRGLQVLVDTSACVLGGERAWCRLSKRRSPAARFEFEVQIPDVGAASFRADEIEAFRWGGGR